MSIFRLSAPVALVLVMMFSGCTYPQPKDVLTAQFESTTLQGLSPEIGISRRDPSDVLEHNGRYYVWYSKSVTGFSGYDATVWYATSEDGERWTEQGEAIARGGRDTWDELSVFTPNILKAEGKFYLFYTAVKPTPGNTERLFENNSTNDYTAIGIAVADSPDGPFVKPFAEPVIQAEFGNVDAFDSYRVDDAAVVVKDGEYWLYYKGRSLKYGKAGPQNTKMGVAVYWCGRSIFAIGKRWSQFSNSWSAARKLSCCPRVIQS